MSEKITLSKTYEPVSVEKSIYDIWLKSGAFHAAPDERGPDRRYVVMMPLPNVTGALHMGHAMDNVMQDLLIRWHRMLQDNTLWMPGTDHAGIATQAVVEKRMKELEGLTRLDVGREGLISRIWKWKDQFQARIIEQQQKMGCSCDWSRQRFTMDAVCARAVRHAFFRMFDDGLIVRGKRLVNWDAYLQTSISDDEVYHETVQGHFWHLKYPVIDSRPGDPQYAVVATTRPETMLGDTAVAVHPDPEAALKRILEETEEQLRKAPKKEQAHLQDELDELKRRKAEELPRLIRFRDMALEGREVMLPLMDRPIPLICDEWAKPDMGTGIVKITPAHDQNDYEVWTRHKDDIDIINILNPDGTLNDNAGSYRGMDRFDAREKVIEDLESKGLMGEIEERAVEIGHSDRSKTPIEPYLSDQRFIRMGDVEGGIVMGKGTDKEHKSPGLVQAAMDAVIDGRVEIHPERYTKTYLDWLSEKRDWPVSRQLWWGHRIPVWSKKVSVDELNLGELVPLINKAPGSMIVRIQQTDTFESLPVNDAFSFDKEKLDPDKDCHIDVCLLEDNEIILENLSQLGYKQDPDVLDTWFSSALWPFSTLGWPDPETAELDENQPALGSVGDAVDCLEYYYPGSCLVTGRDIITLWVARMVLAGLYCLGDIPFSDVFIHANILDGKGERMSKSKGNGIDPVDIIDTYGTDAMRYVLCDMQTGNQDIKLPVTAVCPNCGHHNDLSDTRHGSSIFTYVCGKTAKGKTRPDSCGAEFDVLGTMPGIPAAKLTSERFETGCSFCNKLWNSVRFALMNLDENQAEDREFSNPVLEDRWILAKLNRAIRDVNRALENYNPSSALNAATEFFWGSLCDWYLELIKPRLQEKNTESARNAKKVLAFCIDQVLRLFHPFIPFITEHLWQLLGKLTTSRGLGTVAQAPYSEYLIEAEWPVPSDSMDDDDLLQHFSELQSITRTIREIRSDRDIAPKAYVTATLKPPRRKAEALKEHVYIISEAARVSDLQVDPDAKRPPGSASRIIGDMQVFVHDVINDEEERERLNEMIKKVEGEIKRCHKTLGNEKFVEKAPREVVQKHKDRLVKYEKQLHDYRESLKVIQGD